MARKGIFAKAGAKITKDFDRGYNRLKVAIFGIGRPVVTVGIHAEEGEETHGATADQLQFDSSGRARLFGRWISKKKLEKIQASAANGPPLTVLEVAIMNEFGTDTIPERSFIRAWVDLEGDEARKWMRALIKQVIRGAITKEVALERFGQKVQGSIQARIADGIPPPNAPATVERKGSSTPLIDTGQLRSSITYKVDERK